MSAEQVLRERANSKCELCSSDTSLTVYEIPPAIDSEAENCVLVCEVCHKQIEDPSAMDANTGISFQIVCGVSLAPFKLWHGVYLVA